MSQTSNSGDILSSLLLVCVPYANPYTYIDAIAYVTIEWTVVGKTLPPLITKYVFVFLTSLATLTTRTCSRLLECASITILTSSFLN